MTLKALPYALTVCRLADAETPGEVKIAFFAAGRRALYFDLYSQTGTAIGNPRNQAVSVQFNGRIAAASYPENSSNGLVFLGTAENEYVSVRVTVSKDFSCESFGVFGLDLDRLETALAAAEGAELQYHGGVYTADLRTDAPKTVVLSAAFDEGFTAAVNGKSTEVFRVNGCQTAVRVPAGEHHIVLTAHVPGLGAGILLACFGAAVALLLLLCGKRLPEKLLRQTDRIASACLSAAFAAVLLFVYLMPVVLCILGGIRYFLGNTG